MLKLQIRKIVIQLEETCLEMRYRLSLQRQNSARVADQLGAVVGKDEPAHLALQQLARQGLGQFGQMQADGRWRFVHQLGRPLAAARVSKGHQGAKLFGIQKHVAAP